MWIADLLAHGLIRASFVPPIPVQELRDLTRTRKQLVSEIAQHTQRIQKTLEDANIKITGVISNVLGTSGRALLDALVAGETDPERLVELTRGRLKASRSEGSAKLTGGAEISECIPIVGENTYYLEFKYKQSVAGAAGCQLDFYEGGDCSATLASDMQFIGQETGTSWKHQTLGGFTGVKTMTALVTCFIAMSGATVEFDQIHLGAGANDF